MPVLIPFYSGLSYYAIGQFTGRERAVLIPFYSGLSYYRRATGAIVRILRLNPFLFRAELLQKWPKEAASGRPS